MALAKWLYASRRLRPGSDTRGLFGEPGWDMMLDLYIQRKFQRRTSVTSALIGSGAPESTALRYLGKLIEHGWLERTPDERDKRIHWIALTRAGELQVDEYLDQLLDSLWRILPESLAALDWHRVDRLCTTMNGLIEALGSRRSAPDGSGLQPAPARRAARHA